MITPTDRSKPLDIGSGPERLEPNYDFESTKIGDSVMLPEIIGLPPTFRGVGAGTTEERTFSPTADAAVDLPDWLNKTSREQDPPPVTYSWNKQGESPKNMDDVMIDTMPIMEIIPVEPEFVLGPALYKLKPAMGGGSNAYSKELYDLYNVRVNNKSHRSLKVCIQSSSSFPATDSFTNSFKESMANEWAQNIGRSGDIIRELRTMVGTDVNKATGFLADMAGGLGVTDADISTADKFFKGTAGADPTLGLDTNKIALSAATFAKVAALGNKIDFPQVWNSSGWEPTYNVTVRLYNPHPGDPNYTMAYLVAPLVSLLMFVVPRSSDGITFTSPWLCQFKVPGMYDIKAGYVSNISVQKGGGDNHVAYNQVPGMIDLVISFGTLFNTMVSGPYRNGSGSDRPTLHSYIEPMIKDPKQFVGDTQTDANGFSIHGPKWVWDGYYEEGSATYTRWQAPIFEEQDSTNVGAAFTQPTRQSFFSRVKQFAKDHADVVDFLTGGNV